MSRPTVFISYSWDDEDHKRWVAKLATELRKGGAEARLDQWHTELGDPLPTFMTNEIRDNDFVLVVCTPSYRRKSDQGKGGVGYEGSIMTAEVAASGNHRKYIPVLARGLWEDAAPSWLKGKRFADLSNESAYEENREDLLKTLLGARPGAPPVRPAATGPSAEATSVAQGKDQRSRHPKQETRRRAESRDGERGSESWSGRKAMAAYTVVGLAVAALGLLYDAGLLRQVGLWQLEDQGPSETPETDAQGEASDAPAPREPGTVFADCDDCPSMVVVPRGRFTMGSPPLEAERYPNEGPLRPVLVAEPFAVSVYEVTRGEFRRFVTESGYASVAGCFIVDEREWRFSEAHSWRDVGFEQSDSHPAGCISWHDARTYVAWLSQKSGKAYRLPSESEWEYMARGGTESARYWEEGGEASQCSFANAADASTWFRWRAPCNDGYEYTSPVGGYEPNLFGVYDVLGNVREWTQDCWHDKHSAEPDGTAARERDGCPLRVARGGSRYTGTRAIRSAHRSKYAPSVRNQNTGFRVARTLGPSTTRN